ncbi:putative HTH-type transcriptional regulator [Poriferisphaera corsica]|uniref:Putative HTH-type transcriptional regulator n=1 Tax=Poriferisphaera corsica TaxID=2528020 RepID=A0A517YQN0_9BACT|nr:metalloregulator ArsR/SmtB family transcription factor [Poriferisphaera corsica]QDU32525.1 putative HTH-type transcriptional regulator [Poriferisphaera corsica]
MTYDRIEQLGGGLRGWFEGLAAVCIRQACLNDEQWMYGSLNKKYVKMRKMNKKDQKRYEKQAEMLASIAHPIRVGIVDFLTEDEACVADIAEYVGSERSNVSRHLSVLLKSGALVCRKDGLQVFYSLSTPCTAKFLECANRVLQYKFKEEAKLYE